MRSHHFLSETANTGQALLKSFFAFFHPEQPAEPASEPEEPIEKKPRETTTFLANRTASIARPEIQEKEPLKKSIKEPMGNSANFKEFIGSITDGNKFPKIINKLIHSII